jgi:phage portal protein BeeE
MTTNADGLRIGTEMDLDDLIRMDTNTKVKSSKEAITGDGITPNEARARYLDLGPVPGGAMPYLQQQNYSLEALAKRDAGADPFGTAKPAAPPPAEPPPDQVTNAEADIAFTTAWMNHRWSGRVVANPRELAQ